MKRTILFFALLLMGAGAFAQSGSLTLINNNKDCGVWVNMQAVVNPWDPAACDIVYKTIILPPAGGTPYIITFATPTAFLTFPGPGIGYIAAPIPGTYWLPPPTSGFMWTDVAFQYNCGCGGYMSDNALLTCQNAGNSWNDCGRWATWQTTLPPNNYMNDVTITFN